VNGERMTQRAGEASERALFARRARALPPAALPSLEAVLSAAAADGAPADARPAGLGRRTHAGLVVGLAVLAAACVGGLVVASARASGDFGNRAIVADVDAGVPLVRTSVGAGIAAGETCEPTSSENEDDRTTCGAPQASFVVASSDKQSTACSEPNEPARPASASGPLACERDRDLTCTQAGP
jgi:hypothetical protein